MEVENSIDKILSELDTSGDTKETEIAVKQKTEIVDASDINEVEQELIKQTLEDRKMADKIFNLFFSDLGFKKDRSQASKEAINKALELKIAASRNIIELLKIKKQEFNNLGIFVNTQSSKKVGIDIDNIAKEL